MIEYFSQRAFINPVHNPNVGLNEIMRYSKNLRHSFDKKMIIALVLFYLNLEIQTLASQINRVAHGDGVIEGHVE